MSDKQPKNLLRTILSLDVQPGLVLRAILFALVLPGTLNAAFGVDRQVFLESMALVSTIFDSYVRSIFSVFQLIWIEFADYERIIGQFYLFVVFPVFVTIYHAALEGGVFRSRLTSFLAVPLIGMLSTLLLILLLRLSFEVIGVIFLIVGWVMENAPVIYFLFFNVFIVGVVLAVGFLLKYGGLSFVMLAFHFFQSKPYQNYVIVVLATLAFFLTIELMRLGSGFNHWICQIALTLSPEKESIVTACADFI